MFGTEKLEWFGYLNGEKILQTCTITRFDRIHKRDRQTDGQTLHDSTDRVEKNSKLTFCSHTFSLLVYYNKPTRSSA